MEESERSNGAGNGRGGGKSGRKVYIRVGKYPQVQYL